MSVHRSPVCFACTFMHVLYVCMYAHTRDDLDTTFSKAEIMHFRGRLLVFCVCLHAFCLLWE